MLDGRDYADPRVLPLFQFLEDEVRLLAEINLKADMIDDVVFTALACHTTANGNHSHQVTKCTGIASIVDDADLAFLIGSEHLPHVFYPFVISVQALIAATDTDIWRSLKETTVSTENFVLGITGEAAEGRGAVYDRMVIPSNIDNDERASEVHRPKRNARGWACSYAC